MKEDFAQHACWAVGFDAVTGATTEGGSMLLEHLKMIYAKFDEDAAAQEACLQYLQFLPDSIKTVSLYGSSSNHAQHQWTNLTADTFTQNMTSEAENEQSLWSRG